MTRLAPRHLLTAALALAVCFAHAAGNEAPRTPTIDLSAEASRAAPNDMAGARMYFQADGRDPGALAREADTAIAAALAQARAYPAVKAKTAGAGTYPVYGREGRRIEGWRIRSELEFESRDLTALAELLGKLQNTLALASLTLRPAPETRSQAVDQAAADAIRAFEARAAAVARVLGKPYRIRHLSIAHGGAHPVRPAMRAAMAAEAAPMTIEAGESEITVTVSGTIELGD